MEQENVGDAINLRIGMPTFGKLAEKPPKPTTQPTTKPKEWTPDRGQLGKSNSHTHIQKDSARLLRLQERQKAAAL